MRILFITTRKNDGVFAVRGILPAEHLKKLGHEVEIIEENGTQTGEDIMRMVNWADVISLSRAYASPINYIQTIIGFCQREGKKIIYDTDDLLVNLFPEHPNYEEYKSFVPQIRMLAREADVITVTGEALKSEYGIYNDNVVILPNCINPAEWKLRKGKNRKIKIGWAGSMTHISDLLLVVDVLVELQKDHNFEFTIFGLTSQNWKGFKGGVAKQYEEYTKMYPEARKREWYRKFELLDDSLGKLKWKHIPFVAIDKYKETLSKANFDIGICPLVENRFNSCKSAIKFYEYAMVGTVCLASKVLPYKGEVMYEAKNRHDKWYSKLKHLIEDKELRESVLENQRAFVLKERNMEERIKDWEGVYQL